MYEYRLPQAFQGLPEIQGSQKLHRQPGKLRHAPEI